MTIAAPSFFFFDRDALVARGRALRASYAAAAPFAHAIVDDFLPADVFARVAAGYPDASHPDWKRKDYEEQSARLGALARHGFRGVEPEVRHLLNELNGMAFLDFLEALTGEKGLIPDPHFHGAGFHLTLPGGHLALHSDFARDRFRGLARRVSVLLYVEPEWHEEWGGHLELWDRELHGCVARIAPSPNRLAVLAHGDEHWHGHPSPLACPEGHARKAIAAYYYAVPREGEPEPERRGATWAMHRSR